MWAPSEVTRFFAVILAGCAVRFITLPQHSPFGPRQSGSLLAVPLIVGLFIIMLDIETRGKSSGGATDGDLIFLCGQILLCEWVMLAVWEQHRNRPRQPEANEAST